MEKLIKHQNGQWSLVKSKDEPEEYKLPSGAKLRRVFRGQVSGDPDDHYNDDWSLHDEHGVHLGHAHVYHTSEEGSKSSNSNSQVPELRDLHGGGGLFYHEAPSTVARLPNGEYDPKSYKHHTFMARQYTPEVTSQLANHYGKLTTRLDLDPKRLDPSHKYTHIEGKSVPEMHNWKRSDYKGNDPYTLKYLQNNYDRWAAMPKENWHHVDSLNPSKVDYNKTGLEHGGGGLYAGSDDAPLKPSSLASAKPIGGAIGRAAQTKKNLN